jgi:hypothetical protein
MGQRTLSVPGQSLSSLVRASGILCLGRIIQWCSWIEMSTRNGHHNHLAVHRDPEPTLNLAIAERVVDMPPKLFRLSDLLALSMPLLPPMV